MSWQERMRQMVLAGGVVVAGCSSSQLARPDAAGTGGTGGAGTGVRGGGTGGSGGGGGGTGGAAGGAGRSGNGAAPAAPARAERAAAAARAGAERAAAAVRAVGWDAIVWIHCGNANPDPCICGRPDASASNAALCDRKMTSQRLVASGRTCRASAASIWMWASMRGATARKAPTEMCAIAERRIVARSSRVAARRPGAALEPYTPAQVAFARDAWPLRAAEELRSALISGRWRRPARFAHLRRLARAVRLGGARRGVPRPAVLRDRRPIGCAAAGLRRGPGARATGAPGRLDLAGICAGAGRGGDRRDDSRWLSSGRAGALHASPSRARGWNASWSTRSATSDSAGPP